ncbi:MAG: AAA family ATPase, partial [Betaproteobacteria bacterium]
MNINWLYAWLVVFAILGVAAWGLRSLRRQQEAQDAGHPEQPPVAQQPPAVQQPQVSAAPIELQSGPSRSTSAPTVHPLELDKRLHHLYESVSHPVDLLGQPQFEEGVALFADPASELEQAVTYAIGANDQLAAMGAEALARRGDSAPALTRVTRHLRFANVWTAFFILRFINARATQDAVASVLAQIPNWWARNPLMPQIVSDFIDARFAKGEEIALAPVLDTTAGVEAESVLALLDALASVHARTLRETVSSWHRTHVNEKFLTSIGRMYDASGATVVVEHEPLRAALEAALQALSRSTPQSILITGDPGVGKSALFSALAARLGARGWSIFDASAAEVLAGQVHIGELEQRVQQMLEQLDTRRRVIWHVAQFHELFYAGRHRFNPQGVLDLFLPAIEAGRLCIVGEIQPDALQKLLQARPRLRFAFKEVPLTALAPAAVLAVAEELVAREFAPAQVAVDTTVLREAIDLTRHYMGSRAQPGNVIELLRVTKTRITASGQVPAPINRDDLLASLAQLTGLPRSVLDEQEGLNPNALREFFQQRVMGQPEAVDCLVDR